jgi:cytochrome c biogenesis protein CcmG, thiol:disulfide interchange protein DsbE
MTTQKTKNAATERADNYNSWSRKIRNAVMPTLLVAAAVFAYYLLKTPLAWPDPCSQRGVGETVGYVDLKPLTGGTHSVTAVDLPGRVVLLNFWGTWCRPCRDELPHVGAIYARFADRNSFRLLAVSYPMNSNAGDQTSLREDTASLLQRMNSVMPTYFDPDYQTFDLFARLTGSKGFPTTVLLDRHGKIRAVWLGYYPGAEKEMERHIDELLGEK